MRGKTVKRIGQKTIDLAVASTSRLAIGPAGSALRYASYRANERASARKYEEMFLRNGENSKYTKSDRAFLLEKFRRIDQQMNIKTTPTDGLFLAEALLSVDCPGAAVECGCFNGGSTAKLSLVAKITGRHLFVCDSFEGLPKADSYNTYDFHARRSLEWVKKSPWKVKQYAAPLDLVKANIEKYGEISVCSFIKGWFNETLETALPPEIAFAFTDVDLPSSARDCLFHIWPRLTTGGVYFSHDIAYIKVLQTFNDEHLWKNIFKEHPPIFFGAGYGMCDSSPHLGFAVKGSVSAEYIKGLTYDK